MTTTPSALPRRGTAPAEVLRLSRPHDLVHAIPYLVGFVPRDSVVLVALSAARRRVVMTARVDLDAHPVAALAPAWEAARRQGASAVLLTVHDDRARARPLPWEELAEALSEAAEAAGLNVLDALCVGEERFWSYRCTESACCPPEGRPVQTSGLVAAEMVLRGRGLVAAREDLATELVADPARVARVAAEVERLPVSSGSLPARRAAGLALLDALVVRSPYVAPDDATAASSLVALTDLWVRDSQLLARRGRAEERATRLWVDLARAAPPALRAAPLLLVAVARYREGDGARANVALEAIESEQPGYTMAGLLGDALASAVPPDEVGGCLDEAARAVRRAVLRSVGGRRSRSRRAST